VFRKQYIIVVAISILMLFMGCSTKRNTFTRRAYHNLTSHFNVYWNGEYALKEGAKTLRKNVKDDYSKVLRVYNYGTKAEAASLNSQMDRALEKTSICVQKHSMKFGGRERVRWIDDSYLVMAKAHFYKQDYIAARRTFDFVANEYSKNPIAHVANMWLAKTYIQTEQYPKAIAAIESLQGKTEEMRKQPKELARDLDLVIADYNIAIGDYTTAARYLRNALPTTRDRDMKTRMMFILAQIYQQQGDNEKASELYHKVIRRSPPFEMAFESKLSLAVVDMSSDNKSLYKMLKKMLNDSKNEDYLDRVYYVLADISLKDGKTEDGIFYLKESVAHYKDNKIQQMTSALRLATILFDRNDYETSQAYYDTAVTAMEKTNPIYDSVFNISKTLNELVFHLNMVRNQDSLLRVANMDSVSRIRLIDKIISDVKQKEKEEEEQRRYEEQLALLGSTVGDSRSRSQTTSGSTTGSWYFYNPDVVQRGFAEFTKKWGMRKLEDNWRISDKRSVTSALASTDLFGGVFEEEEEGSPNDTASKALTPHDREYYLTDLPFTPEQKKVADSLIAESLYATGFIYMDKLSDYGRSTKSYLGFEKRYPNHVKELPAWYALYKMYDTDKKSDSATLYKNKILTKYPESNYAQFIVDPDFYKKEEAKNKAASDFYVKTYDAYTKGQFHRVKSNAERAMIEYESDTALYPKFELLRALSMGKLYTADSMATALYEIVKKNPRGEVHDFALAVLNATNAEYDLGMDIKDVVSEKDTVEVKKNPYVYEPQTEHLVMIVCNTSTVRVDPLKIRIADFNKRDYSVRTFNVRSIQLDKDRTIVSISSFKDFTAAYDYVVSLVQTDYVFGGMNKEEYHVYPVSIKNYPVFYQNKDIEEYKQFYDNLNLKN